MIEARNLTKVFGTKPAVNDISFEVDKGEVLGFLGPNAAGKSTTMRMITGYLSPTSGTAVIGGSDIISNPLSAQKKIGYLPENAPTYSDMTVFGFLDFIAEIRGFSGKNKNSTIEKAIEQCFLQDVRFQPINTLSKGFNQRVCFAQSILHDPEYLIMDEPTDGLDPNQKHEVRSMIKEMALEKTIILSTHILEEVDAVCTRAIIISGGAIVADDTPENLKTRSSIHGAVCIRCEKSIKEDALKDLNEITEIKNVDFLGETDTEILIRVYPMDPNLPPVEKIMKYFETKQVVLNSFFIEEGQLDDVFRQVTT